MDKLTILGLRLSNTSTSLSRTLQGLPQSQSHPLLTRTPPMNHGDSGTSSCTLTAQRTVHISILNATTKEISSNSAENQETP